MIPDNFVAITMPPKNVGEWQFMSITPDGEPFTIKSSVKPSAIRRFFYWVLFNGVWVDK